MKIDLQNSQKVKEKIEYPFKIGDIVKSYGLKNPGVIDRLYERGDAQMARLVSGNKRINVHLSYLEYHPSHFRSEKLKQLGI